MKTWFHVHCRVSFLVLTCFIDIRTSKELIKVDINKMMTSGIFTMNDKIT